jgi:hypothetical protein
MSLPFYAANGWEPVVLTVADRCQVGVRENELVRTLPDGLRVVSACALPLRISRLVGIGNIGLRAWPFLMWRGAALLRREKFDLVLISTTQFIVFALGPVWQRLTGVPYILDMQDPWVTDHYERPGSRPPPGGWKYPFARLQARLLEGPSFSGAAGIISVSPRYLEALNARYPEVARKPCAVIGFGASRGDLAIARALPASAHALPRGDGRRHIVYTGAAGPLSQRLLALLFSALGDYRKKDPSGADKLRIHFLGTSYVVPGAGRPAVLPVAERWSVSSLVTELPHRIGFFEALRLQQDSDALLLIGSDDAAYSPSKLYPYYLTGRPILALVFRGSVIESQLDELACASVVRWDGQEPDEEARAQLLSFLEKTSAGTAPRTDRLRDETSFNSRFLAEGLTKRQCALFNQALLQGPLS